MKLQKLLRISALLLGFCLLLSISAVIFEGDSGCCHPFELCKCTICATIRVFTRLISLSTDQMGKLGMLCLSFLIPCMAYVFPSVFLLTPVTRKDKLSN